MARMIDARSVLAVSRDGFKAMLGHCADETPAGELSSRQQGTRS
jgi:hypothetical protein